MEKRDAIIEAVPSTPLVKKSRRVQYSAGEVHTRM